MNKTLLLIPVVVSSMFVSCASVSMLPDSANQVDFNSREGKTGWSKYEQVQIFKNTSTADIYDAAKVGLGDAGFSLRKADLNKGVAIGEHGITLQDWNVIAGVYFKPVQSGTKVKVIVEGSKDIDFSGDVTSDGWAGKILKGMRQHLNETNYSVLKVKKSDLR